MCVFAGVWCCVCLQGFGAACVCRGLVLRVFAGVWCCVCLQGFGDVCVFAGVW